MVGAHGLCIEVGLGTNGVRESCINREGITGIEMNEKLLSELSARLAAFAAANPAKDLEKNFRALLSGAFERLDLVSREEYDAQARVLAQAREMLTALEARVAEIESRGSSTKN